LITLNNAQDDDEHHCVMYGVCNNNGIAEQNCFYNGSGIVLNNETAEEILKRRCFDFYKDGKKFAKT
jgi:hypothetical protein